MGGKDRVIGTWNLVTVMGSKKMENVNLDFLPYLTETLHKQEVYP